MEQLTTKWLRADLRSKLVPDVIPADINRMLQSVETGKAAYRIQLSLRYQSSCGGRFRKGWVDIRSVRSRSICQPSSSFSR